MPTEFTWTKDQQDAIDARDGSLLLSAAAGSGKTAVLVERLVRILTDPADPTEPGSLLVVTFTRAAAAQMRRKLEKNLRRALEADPLNDRLRRVIMQLPDAQISTIDAFCGRIVRENFEAADIAPDYQILDDSRLKAFQAEAMLQTLEELSREDARAYDMLCAMTGYKKSDKPLEDAIRALHQKSVIHPFPDRWLDDAARQYDPDTPVEQTVWGEILLEYGKECVDFALCQLEDCLYYADRAEGLAEKYGPTLTEARNQYASVASALNTDHWSEICAAVTSLTLSGLPTIRGALSKDPYKELIKKKYDSFIHYSDKNTVEKQLKEIFSITNAMHREDMTALHPAAKALTDCVRAYDRKLTEMKRDAGAYAHEDILHKTIDLLVAPDGTRTALAEQLSRNYRYILVDEFQDTNEAQDLLFRMISRDETNLFMVGDVKQSIYRFRGAMPEVFMEKYRRFAPFDGRTYPAKILLSANFRSRKGVLDNINRVFYRVMSVDAGGIDYTPADALYYGGLYDNEGVPPDEDCFELLFCGKSQAPIAAARRVREMLDSGFPVTEDGATRPCRPGDFCILLRNMNAGGKDLTKPYRDALAQCGVSSSAQRSDELLKAPEIRVFLSLLRAVSNPRDDVSLLAVLFSPLYGCTPDDAARWKEGRPRQKLIRCLRAAADDGDDRAAKILSDLAEYRAMCAVLPLERFTRELLELTGYDSIASAMPGGAVRRQNLIRFCAVAASYAGNSDGTIGAFLRYIDRIEESGISLKTEIPASEAANAVQIYSIHKSKGLEFPIVILGDTQRDFNSSDRKGSLIISGRAGVGLKRVEPDKLKKYDTVASLAAAGQIGRDNVSEEMRTLYVALTRAREKLIVPVCDPEEVAQDAAKYADRDGKIHPLAVLRSARYDRWIAMALLTNGAFRRALGGTLPDASPTARDDAAPPVIRRIELPEDADAPQTSPEAPQADEAIVEAIRERAEYVYPYVYPDGLRPKSVASDFEKREPAARVYTQAKPAFLSPDGLTAAQRGTVNHTFLEHWDLRTDPRDALNAFVRSGLFTETQSRAVQPEKALAFAESALGRRILASEKVLRERDFAVTLPVSAAAPEAAANVRDDPMMIVGKADLVFIEPDGAVVVDYKTDRGKTPEDFIRVYEGQLRIYRRAMEIVLDMPVKQTYIYSLELGTAIEIP